MGDSHNIYSIGHGNKTIGTLIDELKTLGITHLIDVRSKPFSKWSPHFSQGPLSDSLNQNAVRYVFLGKELGGLPEDKSCYVKGKVDYDLMKETTFFKEGLHRLIVANQNEIKVAIMCSESKPQECHRSKLIGQELLKHDISIQHIINKVLVKSQEIVMTELNKGLNTTDLFGDETNFTSRKTYD